MYAFGCGVRVLEPVYVWIVCFAVLFLFTLQISIL